MKKSWEVFHDRLLLGRCFTGSVLPILEYCSADTHLKLLDSVVSGESFLTEGMSECDLAHRRYVAVLRHRKCTIKRVQRVCCTISGLTRCTLFMVLFLCRMCRCGLHAALIAHRFTYAPPRCRTSWYRRTFFPLSVSLWNDLGGPAFDGVGLAGFKSRANCLFIDLAARSLLSPAVFPFSSFILWVGIVGRVFGLIGCLSLSPSLALPTILNNNNKNNNNNNNKQLTDK